MMERSHSLASPWKIRQLIHLNPAVDKEPNQGGFVELSSHCWYFVSHQGRGDWEGRAGVLLPVTWSNGWPILGQVGPDGIGHMAWHGTKPIRSRMTANLSTSDSFDAPSLSPAWEWNYQPRPGTWSLHERPGYLRLHAYQPIRPDDFKTIGNVLTQRSLRSRRNQVTVKLDLTGMVDRSRTFCAHVLHYRHCSTRWTAATHPRQRRKKIWPGRTPRRLLSPLHLELQWHEPVFLQF
jgi:beta-xylosidase